MMVMKKVTPDMIKEWKRIYEENRNLLLPNRKSGIELERYLKTHYVITPIIDREADKVVLENIIENEIFRDKLPKGVMPNPVTYYVGESKVFVGIDLVTGYFYVEGSEKIHDELFAYRGLDDKELDNYYLVAEYVRCTEL
ncbi:MAG: hypothetical protein Q4F05_19140 [bacterium]|nr:hypothetical protein [bacterium]